MSVLLELLAVKTTVPTLRDRLDVNAQMARALETMEELAVRIFARNLKIFT